MTKPHPTVAVIGAGISGLAAAHALRADTRVSLFEAGDYFGGHAHTVELELPVAAGQRPVRHGVDTGFLVYNDRTYPHLIALFAELGVETAASEMSFSVQAHRPDGQRLEWSGNNLSTVFAQRRNLLDGRFLGMLADLLRFNRLTTRIAEASTENELAQPLRDFLDAHRFGAAFRDWYFLPMMGCIWSCPTQQMLAFPVATMIRFCHNHGLLQIADRPQWRTVRGGSRHYVEKIVAGLDDARLGTPVRRITRTANGVLIATDNGTERFDHVVLAAHSDQSLALLADASPAERATLGAIRYQPNRAVLHTDASVLPQRRAAWAAWNYEAANATDSPQVCLHYLLNKLQPLPWQQPVVVSLNPQRPIARSQVMAEYDYSHPVFDLAALRAQADVQQLQGRRNTWFAGAWMGYGFHEDGLKAGLAAAAGVRRRLAGGNDARQAA
ncbi:FAD-dependent oxidoreductase [Variovorax sp. J22G21]|uniref:NAD(P)/FAD-dependent oxidoreductase n=1 Tax=Variovorax fucosicus TaxID=3053517 RepID=UPI00257658C2|nr:MULTISPECIES: FAD-dependent oxidoreductase [unclassified Variovorax]MDM0039494.1 FAD-dependent oxidoreductase [Variovorax sp. J22R193]MDM0064269.1 FAD-dependent oxidoreductase [Variovorax sp. J22G21]